MKEVNLTVKVITPLFMGGANQKAELRSQSIKGIIRYWWRALKATNDIKKLMEEEAKIFGGYIKKNKELEAISSNIKLFVKIINFTLGVNIKNDFDLKWSFNKEEKKLYGYNYGIGYLFYSVLNRQYYKPETKFEIRIYSRNEEYLKQTLAALWCTIYLGGFGARSRRGAGSCVVEDISGNVTDINFIPNDQNIVSWYKNNFDKCINLIGKNESFVYPYSNLSISRILVSKNNKNNFDKWYDALNDLGKKYSDFRYENRVNKFEVGSFGLPVIHSDKQKLLAIKNIGNGKKEIINRRSSPLIFRIIEFNKRFYWIVLRLAGEFLPDEYVLSFNNKTQKADYNLIDKFWNSLKQDNKAEECVINLPMELIKLKERISNNGIKKIILFGSKARGDFNKRSDTDLALDNKLNFDLIGNYDIVNINNQIDKNLRNKIDNEGIEI
jgi:CRISPR-associated protein Cmr1